MGTRIVLVIVCAGGVCLRFNLPRTGERGGSSAATCRDASRSRSDRCRISSTAGPKVCPGDIGMSVSHYKACQALAQGMPLKTGNLEQRA
ncbi:UNVERIFIED_CONTAM: hypothetical protein FKN15_021306 [Acipenser sinensis]